MVSGAISLSADSDTEIKFTAPIKNASYLMSQSKKTFVPPEEGMANSFEYFAYGNDVTTIEIDAEAMTGEGLTPE